MRFNPQKLQEIRENLNIPRIKVAKALGYKHASDLFYIEKGKRRLTLDKAAILVKLYKISLDDLFEKEPTREEKMG